MAVPALPYAGDPDVGPSGSVQESNPDPAVGSNRPPVAGRYKLDAMIGHGATGSVWAATDQLLRRRVALKKIDIPRGMPPADAEELRERTLREARAVAALSNPHIVTVYDILAGTDTGPVIVMELLEGQSLARLLATAGRMRPDQAATIGVAVASALAAAHTRGIVHRDVKPANILICRDGMVKLTDFGTARGRLDDTLTGIGLVVGSPAYIAPELATGSPAGPAADAWSLGCTLYACVEGHPPFRADNALDTVSAVVHDPVPPHPHAGELSIAIAALLEKSPEERAPVEAMLPVLREIAGDPSGIRVDLSGTSAAEPTPPDPDDPDPTVATPSAVTQTMPSLVSAWRRRLRLRRGHTDAPATETGPATGEFTD
ncbi:MAG TPA: serine/threonine-protein kinase [Nakamurella sp.]